MRPNEYQQPATPLVNQDGQLQIKLGTPWYLQTNHHIGKLEGARLLKQQLATKDDDFMMGIVNHAIKIAGGTKADDASVNTVFAIIRAVKPNTELETLLAVQMAATHFALVDAAAQLTGGAGANDPRLVDSASNALSKLSRTFTGQLAALNRERDRKARDEYIIELKEPIKPW